MPDLETQPATAKPMPQPENGPEPEPLHLCNRRVHFVGIGGCGMSGLARIVRAAGGICSGSDIKASPAVESLIADGFEVWLDQRAETVPPDCEILVASAAVKPDHPELTEARRRGLPVFKYAQMLGRMMIGRTGIAIAGTHGKSTTTAMLAHALLGSGCDPSFVLGATCEQIGGGSRAGRPDLLIGEACEFDRSFHNFSPTHSVILNVEADHLDIYGSLDAVVESFAGFAQRTVPHGSLLIHHDDAHREAVTAELGCRVETIGFNPRADWVVQTDAVVAMDHNGDDLGGSPAQRVTLSRGGRVMCQFNCRLPGKHMAYNAAVAAVTAHRLDADWKSIGRALSGFRGLDRRMQLVGHVNGAPVIDDYGHHPTEIEATLSALRSHHRPEKRGGRLICVFQPHQHSRTRFLLDRFAESFSAADEVIVPPIYFVRDNEDDRASVSAADLVDRLRQRGSEAHPAERFEEVTARIRQEAGPEDLVVVMGAGPVWKIARELTHPTA